MSVGDVILNASNYYQFKKENKLFLLGLSKHKDCPYCCISERILSQAHELFKSKLFSFDTKKGVQQIKIARVDSGEDSDFIKLESFSNEFEPPVIYLFYEGRYFAYDNTLSDVTYLIQFINRILHPVITLKNEKEVLSFVNQSVYIQDYKSKFFKHYVKHHGEDLTALKFYTPVNYANLKYKTRVLVLIYEKGDYDEEIKEIKMAARFLANREEVRIGLVTDSKMIKKYKKEQPNWFKSRSSFNSMVIKRYDGEVFVVDLISREEMTSAY
jgi:hypothetical protein